MVAKLMRPERVFLSLKDFYAADERRIGSGEVDFGVMWGSKWPYAALRRHVEDALEGWYDHCLAGVGWVEFQLQKYNEKHPESLPRWLVG